MSSTLMRRSGDSFQRKGWEGGRDGGKEGIREERIDGERKRGWKKGDMEEKRVGGKKGGKKGKKERRRK